MKNNAGNVLIIGVILVALVSIGVGFAISKALIPTPTPQVSQTTKPSVTNTPTPRSNPTNTPPPTPPPSAPTYTDPNVKTFTSNDLGIRFSYLEK